jgi:hypothetical protein
MDPMTAPSPRDRPLSASSQLGSSAAAPLASETTRFPSAAVFAAALEASPTARSERRPSQAETALAMRDLRVLLEENLSALRAVYEDQRLTIANALRTVDSARDELRTLGQPEAPWIAALDQTRALIRAAFAEIAAQHANRR